MFRVNFETKGDIDQFDDKVIERQISESLREAFDEYIRRFLNILLAHPTKGGLPVLTGRLKSSFEQLALHYGADYHDPSRDEIIDDRVNKKNRNLFLTEIGEGEPAFDTLDFEFGGGLVRWELHVPVSRQERNFGSDPLYFWANEFGDNRFPHEQIDMPWNLTLKAKTKLDSYFRKRLNKALRDAIRFSLTGRRTRETTGFEDEVPF